MQYGPTLYTMPIDESMSNLSICAPSKLAFMEVCVNLCAHAQRRAFQVFINPLQQHRYLILANP